MRTGVLTAAFLLGIAAATAAESGIEVLQAWARAPAGGGPGALYLSLHDSGPGDRLLGVTTDAGGMAMLHASASSNGIETMRDVPYLALPAGGTVAMRPGGVHVMLMGMDRTPRAGETLHATLHFAHAAPVKVTVRVFPPGSPGPPELGLR